MSLMLASYDISPRLSQNHARHIRRAVGGQPQNPRFHGVVALGNDEPTEVEKASGWSELEHRQCTEGLALSPASSDGREAVLLHAPAAAHIGFWNLSTN